MKKKKGGMKSREVDGWKKKRECYKCGERVL